MNRLKNHTCYLAGPMDFCREDGKLWRADVEEFLESLNINVLNPYHKPLCKDTHNSDVFEDDANYAIVKEALAAGNYDEVRRRFKQVRAIDLRLVDKCDFLVAFLNFDVIITGTLEEIVTANRERKPVIIVSSRPKSQMPPWYFGMLPHETFFENFKDAKEYIRHINEDKEIDLLGNRWVFFDYN